jgi:hypothetical protein
VAKASASGSLDKPFDYTFTPGNVSDSAKSAAQPAFVAYRGTAAYPGHSSGDATLGNLFLPFWAQDFGASVALSEGGEHGARWTCVGREQRCLEVYYALNVIAARCRPPLRDRHPRLPLRLPP